MKVLKFGGSSVGSIEGLKNVKKVVESVKEPLVVVVSALGGVTDTLLGVARTAASKDKSYAEQLQQMEARHYEIIDALVPTGRKKDLLVKVDGLFEELRSLCQGIYLLKDLTQKSENAIVSYGERLSSNIVAAYLDGAVRYNALAFVKTFKDGGRNVVDNALTEQLIREAFRDFPAGDSLVVVPGFIAADRESGEITNLGRGGSDYTASIIAAALGAEILEIWTDVDGFMTADPRIIQNSYVIDQLSYEEAMELCNFGAKVIYTPTLYPVYAKNIPILIKNTFHPEAKGTVIRKDCDHHGRAITGISSISGTALITLSGPTMVGVVGVNSLIFSALARHSISVFFVSQASSEVSISIGVKDEDASLACEVLGKVFEKEISVGALAPLRLERHLATVAIVGENMRRATGIAGKLFTTLGRNGISIIACAQGASETNISFVVKEEFMKKSLNVIHDSFFLSEYKELNLFLCGIGTVGGQLLEQIASQSEKLKKERGLKLNVVGIARSTRAIFDRSGIDLGGDIRSLIRDKGIDIDVQELKNQVIGMNIFNSVFVDCTASSEVAGIYEELFNHGVSVVTANKIAASSEYETYARLKTTARRKGVKFLFETNVGAGLPIINTINDLVNSGDRIQKIEAVLSGTLNFIFNAIAEDTPLSETVRQAKEQGYSEPDPRIDLSGKDVIRKLVILSREAGYRVNQEDVRKSLFIPKEFFDCTEAEFWAKLPSLDADFEARRKVLESKGCKWKFVAKMENGACSVSLQEVDARHPFYNLEGSNNIILLTTERYHDYPMMIQGYGAGAGVTAAGVFADIMSIANI